MKAQFGVVKQDREHNIVFIEDIANYTGGTTITNDAEAVFQHWARVFGPDVRVVYKDTEGEWWEIVGYPHNPGRWDVIFRPWYGDVWDRLSQVEQ